MSDSNEAPDDSGRRLDKALVHGLAWTAGVRYSTQVITWVGTLVVASLLDPGDYGLLAMASVYFGFVAILNEFGLGASIIILRDLSHAHIAQINTLAILLALSLFGLSALVAAPIGAFFESPELPSIILALSTVLIVSSFGTVPMALLQLDLRFKHLALIGGLQAIGDIGITLILAYLGYGYWSLVAGYITRMAISSAAACALRPHAFAIPRFRQLRAATRISSDVILGNIFWYVCTRTDYLIAGKFLGKTTLGYYTFAFTLAGLAVEKISAIVGGLTPAFFSAVQKDPAQLRRYFLNLTVGLSLLTIPMSWGLALVADDLVWLILGEKWAPMIRPLQILAFYGAFASLFPVLTPLLNVTGHTRFVMAVQLATALVLPVGFFAGVHFLGIDGVAIAWLIIHPALTLLLYRRAFKVIDITAATYLRALWPAASASLVMAAAVLGAHTLAPADFPRIARISIDITAGVIAYTAIILIFHRGSVATFRRALTLLKKKKLPPTPAAETLGA